MDVFIGLCFPFFSRSSSLSFPSGSRASSSFLTCSNICILANFFRAKVSKVRANSLLSSASTMANCFNSKSVHFLSQTSGRFFPFLAAAILFPWSLDCMQLLTLKCVSLIHRSDALYLRCFIRYVLKKPASDILYDMNRCCNFSIFRIIHYFVF